MISSLNNRVKRLEHSGGRGRLIIPASDGNLPDNFVPFVDRVDLSSVPPGLTVSWKGEPLDELALIFGPNPIPHEEALLQLD